MKLKRENYTKTQYEGGTLHQYVCKDTNFYLLVKSIGSKKDISVFKGSLDNREDEFKTSESLEAWQKFEDLIKVCESDQGSSGGFAKNPNQNVNVIPLFAIKSNDKGKFQIALFVALEKEQLTVMEFEVSKDALKYPYPTKPFIVDWSDEEVPSIVKCEVLMKLYKDVEYEEDKQREVFLFIPKSIQEQGGDKGGEEEDGQEGEEGQEGEPQEGKGKKGKKGVKGKKGEKGEKGEEKQEMTEDIGEPQEGRKESDEKEKEGEEDKKGKGEKEEKGEESEKGEEEGEKGGEEGEEEGEKEEDESKKDEKGDESDDESGSQEESKMESKGGQKDGKLNFGDTINKISDIANVPASELFNWFRNVTPAQTWLEMNDFKKIKKELNLPSNMTAKKFAEQIIEAQKEIIKAN